MLVATKKAAVDFISSLDKSISKLQREKNAICSLKRSEVGQILDFRVGLKDLDGKIYHNRIQWHLFSII